MASEIIVDFAAIQLVADIMANAEKEIDSVTTEIYYIKGDVSDGWSGEAKEMFVENCHTLRQKGVEVTYNLQQDRENLQKAAGIFVATENKNKNIEQNLSTENIFV